jgi:hypothetical protein
MLDSKTGVASYRNLVIMFITRGYKIIEDNDKEI